MNIVQWSAKEQIHKSKKIKIKQAINDNQNIFQKVADKWIELQTTNGFTTKTINTIRNSLNNYIYPTLGDVHITQLKTQDFILILRPLECAGKLETLNRIIQRINKVMDYVFTQGIIDIQQQE